MAQAFEEILIQFVHLDRTEWNEMCQIEDGRFVVAKCQLVKSDNTLPASFRCNIFEDFDDAWTKRRPLNEPSLIWSKRCKNVGKLTVKSEGG